MKTGKIALVAVSVLLGLMISLQYKSTQEAKQVAFNMRAEDLYQQLMQVEKEKDILEKTLADIQNSGYEERVKIELDNLRYRAGLVGVEGPGVLLTVSDSKKPLKTGENQNIYLIHDEDLLKIVNELRAAGAEAIAINDQRLIGSSEIRCAGPTVTVNGKMFVPPFKIKAIGDPGLLIPALEMRGGVADTLKYWGIDLQIERVEELYIPAYSGPLKSDFAKPTEDKKV